MTHLLDGRLSITTPEGVRLKLTPAGPSMRAFAWGIDILLWLCAFGTVASFLGNSRLGAAFNILLLFISYWGYPVISEVYFSGRTLGKRIVGIEVVRADGLPVGWRESSLRNLLLVADFMPFMYASGLLCMLFDTHFRRLGDMVARTQVVYSQKPPARGIVPDAKPIALPFPLTPEQQRTLADLFAREASLPPDRMLELADIAAPLTGRSGEASLERLRGITAGLAR